MTFVYGIKSCQQSLLINDLFYLWPIKNFLWLLEGIQDCRLSVLSSYCVIHQVEGWFLRLPKFVSLEISAGGPGCLPGVKAAFSVGWASQQSSMLGKIGCGRVVKWLATSGGPSWPVFLWVKCPQFPTFRGFARPSHVLARLLQAHHLAANSVSSDSPAIPRWFLDGLSTDNWWTQFNEYNSLWFDYSSLRIFHCKPWEEVSFELLEF